LLGVPRKDRRPEKSRIPMLCLRSALLLLFESRCQLTSFVTRVCECIFEEADAQHPDYSAVEHDLYPSVGPRGEAYSIRRNIGDSLYEIFDYEHEQRWSNEAVWFSDPDLEDVVDAAKELEESATGDTKLNYGHNPDTLRCDVDFYGGGDLDTI